MVLRMTNTQLYWTRIGLGLSHEQLASGCGLAAERLAVLESGGDHIRRFEDDLLRIFLAGSSSRSEHEKALINKR